MAVFDPLIYGTARTKPWRLEQLKLSQTIYGILGFGVESETQAAQNFINHAICISRSMEFPPRLIGNQIEYAAAHVMPSS